MGLLDHLLPLARTVGSAGRRKSELLISYNPQSVRAIGRVDDIHYELKHAAVLALAGTRERIECDLPIIEKQVCVASQGL